MSARQVEKQELPKPRTGYVVVCPGWDPNETPTEHANLLTLNQARNVRDQNERLKSPRTRILKLTTTYQIVEDGEHG